MISPFASPEMTVVTSIVLALEVLSCLLCGVSIFEFRRIERRHDVLLARFIDGQKKSSARVPQVWFYLFITISAALCSTALYLFSPHVLPS